MGTGAPQDYPLLFVVLGLIKIFVNNKYTWDTFYDPTYDPCTHGLFPIVERKVPRISDSSHLRFVQVYVLLKSISIENSPFILSRNSTSGHHHLLSGEN